jgi:hypothetical protein
LAGRRQRHAGKHRTQHRKAGDRLDFHENGIPFPVVESCVLERLRRIVVDNGNNAQNDTRFCPLPRLSLQ